MHRFLHAQIHRVLLAELVTAQLAADKSPPRQSVAICPTCGQTYVADIEPHENPLDLDLEGWEALAKLDGECPDHPHSFVVGV